MSLTAYRKLKGNKMRFRFTFTTLLLVSLLMFANQIALAQNEGRQVAPAVATILARSDGERFKVVGSGVFVRGYGVLLTAYSLVRDKRELQVRLANGETYDNAEVVATDERRNVAVLRIYATSTPFVIVSVMNESAVGVGVNAIYSTGGPAMIEGGGILSSISLADEIPGAGTGFRVLKFTSTINADAAGGVLVDSQGHALGLIAPHPQARTQNYAVPLYNVVGLVRGVPTAQPTTAALVLAPGTPAFHPSDSRLAISHDAARTDAAGRRPTATDHPAHPRRPRVCRHTRDRPGQAAGKPQNVLHHFVQ